MQRSSIVARLHALPMRHKIVAAAIAGSVIAVSLVLPVHRPERFVSSAVLSFDGPGYEQSVRQGRQARGPSAKDLAESILRDDAREAATAHSGSTGGLFSNDQGKQYPAHLTLMDVPPSQLRVTWQGDAPDETVAAANEVSQLLASWVPADTGSQQKPANALTPPAPALPAAIVSKPQVATPQQDANRTPADHEASLKDQTQLMMQIANTDHRLAELTAEQSKRVQSLQQAKAERQRQLAARQPLEAQLETAKQKLEALRIRYTDDYPDVQTAQENLADIQSKLAALPAVRQISTDEQAGIDAIAKQIDGVRADRGRLLQSLIDLQTKDKDLPIQPPSHEQISRRATKARTAIASKPLQERPKPDVDLKTERSSTPPQASEALISPFGIVEPARVAEPIDSQQFRNKWPGVAFGALPGIIYLAVALWWFRPVPGVAALEQFLTREVAYVGSIPRMIR